MQYVCCWLKELYGVLCDTLKFHNVQYVCCWLKELYDVLCDRAEVFAACNTEVS